VATVSTTSVTFAARAVNAGASAAQAVTLSNTGAGQLNVTSSTITGAAATSFARTTNCTSLIGAATCTFNVTFAPTTTGNRVAQLNIVTNAGTIVVNLASTGVNNTAATGAPTISDTTPTEGTAITASIGTVADANGIPATATYQWRQSTTPTGAVGTVIANATGATFTPTQAQSNRRLTVTINFVDNAGTAESRVSAITTVVGDLFPGAGDSNTGVNVLAGTAGQDVYHGGNSNDNLSTGTEADLVSGDAGDDTVSTGGDADTITYSGTGEGFDAVTGGAGTDAIIAVSDATNIGLRSISTVETISANGHSGVRILGSTLNDVLNFTGVTLINIIEIDGGGGNDAITGSVGSDTIIGRAGTDTLNGGNGADIIEGGGGNDTMNGGADNDMFRYLVGGFGADTITGFDAAPAGGQDLLDVRGLGITAANFASRVVIANAGGGNALITIAGQGTIRLTGVTAANVNSTDFLVGP
jgi:Ca2+-binding RTX toxin-like protein